MDLTRNEIPQLSNVDFRHVENMFTVKEDQDGFTYYDLTDTVYINPNELSPILFSEHSVSIGDNFYSLSRRYYDNTNLWWIIATVNRIDNPFDLQTMVGDTIKIPIKSLVSEILSVLRQ